MKLAQHIFLGAVLILSGCKSAPDAPDSSAGTLPTGEDASVDPAAQNSSSFSPGDLPENAAHPRWSYDGSSLTFHAGEPGERSIYVSRGGATTELDLGEGDFVDPAFTRDGKRVIYAASTSQTDGFDLFTYNLESESKQQLTNLPGTERAPVVNPLLFGFYAVENGICGGDATGVPVDSYEKVLFVSQSKPDGPRTIRYTSLEPLSTEGLYPHESWPPDNVRTSTENGTHAGTVTNEHDCHSPRFSNDGLHALWTCETPAGSASVSRLAFDDNFEATLRAIESGESCEVSWSQTRGWQAESCLQKLPKRYTKFQNSETYDLESVTDATFSANAIEVLAAAQGRAFTARRTENPSFAALNAELPSDIRSVSWSPDGASIALEHDSPEGSTVSVQPVTAYLQNVKNLYDFPELWADTDSDLLAKNRFVARPSDEKEYYVAYEKARYAQRPLFVTADVALQAFRDEFQIILQAAEEQAAEDLRLVSKAMMEHYATQDGTTSRYLAIYFATAWVPLESAARLETPTFDEMLDHTFAQDDTIESQSGRPTVDEMMKPGATRILSKTTEVIAEVPSTIRRHVRRHIDTIYASSSTGKLAVPGISKPVRIDWTQFRPRGPYADGNLVGYFYAMSWFAQAPLPFEKKALEGLLDHMKNNGTEGKTWWERWQRTDALVGAFMGKPGAATPAHVKTLRKNNAEEWHTFDPKEITEKLEALRGPVTLRDLDAFADGEDSASLKIMLFPKRVGLDTTYFRALIHPDVEERYLPTPLDPFAVWGSDAARRHALERDKGEDYFDAYKTALETLEKDHGELATTDIYHAWLAVLATLATSDASRSELLDYAQNDAWEDRVLHSSLVGYTQLKHSAVLYNMQDMSAECDGQQSVYFLSERPLVPKPRGSVDPVPDFFRALVKLTDRVYTDMNSGRTPKATFWDSENNFINAKLFASDLADLAQKVHDGVELSDRDYAWIRSVGGRLESLLLREKPMSHGISASPETRLKRGVAIATDIHTFVQSRRVLQIGVGRLLRLWVAVPDEVGSLMTQGYLGSYYEFLHPMSDRLTDEAWNTMLEGDKAPPRPEWTQSFIEE